MNEAVSVVYATHRHDPAFQWFADGLANQLCDEDVEVIVVDGQFCEDRTAQFEEAVAGRFALRHVPAKPNPLNGPHRLTSVEYFAASSARNTGIVYASKPYVVFVDDASVPMPGWWSEVVEAARHQYLVGGAYQKHREMRVERGNLVSSEPSGIDHRWDRGDDRRVVPLSGGHLYGCSMGIPRAVLLDVNGFDELCDSIAGEDYQLGLRLENAGHRLFYSRRMLTIESEEHHAVGPRLIGLEQSTLPEREYRELLRHFGVDRRHTDGPFDASHMVLDILHGREQRRSLGNPYLLSHLGPEQLATLTEVFPQRHWFSGQALSEL